MKDEIRILLLEDTTADAELAKFALREGGLSFTLHRVDNREDFIQALKTFNPDLILSDYSLPNFDGCRALEIARKTLPDTPFIFVTGTLGEEVAIETLKNGATDYILKTRLARLVPAVYRALRESEERKERKRAEERLRDSHEQLRALSVYLQYVREEERTRIAREVHDELGQSLTGLKLDVAWLRNRLPRDQKPLLERTAEIIITIDSTIQTVRRIATELRPGILDDLGLVAAIEWQANEFQSHTGITCQVDAQLSKSVFDQDTNTAFFRIFQETLTNIMRHAQASAVEVSLREDSSALVLEVQDNGRGITPAEITSTKSIGLLGMRERAGLLGGDVTISGAAKKGTHVTVRIPLPTPYGTRKVNHENSHRGRSRSSAPRAEAHTG